MAKNVVGKIIRTLTFLENRHLGFRWLFITFHTGKDQYMVWETYRYGLANEGRKLEITKNPAEYWPTLQGLVACGLTLRDAFRGKVEEQHRVSIGGLRAPVLAYIKWVKDE